MTVSDVLAGVKSGKEGGKEVNIKELKIALCQMQTQKIPGDNLQRAVVLVAEAAAGGNERRSFRIF